MADSNFKEPVRGNNTFMQRGSFTGDLDNTSISPGIYFVWNSAAGNNKQPSEWTDAYWFLVFPNGTGQIMQLIFPWNFQVAYFWGRSYVNNTWGNWKKIGT